MNSRGGKRIAAIVLFSLTAAALAGCGKVKTEEKAEEWADEKFAVRAEVIDSLELENGMKYTLQTDDDVTFDVFSEMESLGANDSWFGKMETTRSNYYEKLIDFYHDAIEKIEMEHGVRFIRGYKNVITAVYRDKPNLKEPEKDLVSDSEAVKELFEIIHPRMSYNQINGNRIYVTADPEVNDCGECYLEFNETEPGKLVDCRDKFYRQRNQTYPQIKEDAEKWGSYKYPDYYGIRFRFYYPKTMALIQCCPERGTVDQEFYVDVKKYNELYKKSGGKVTEEDFETCIMK